MANRTVLTPREANRFLSVLSNATARARMKSYVSNLSSSPSTARRVYSIYDPGDRILQFPIAREDKVISLFQDMKEQLAEDSVS
jgi:hypothetical protein